MNRAATTQRPRRLIAPLAPLAIAFAVGIVADRFGPGPSTWIWAGIAVIAGLVAMARPGCVLVIIGFLALGGARHHGSWSDLEPDHLAREDWSTPRPAWIRGAIIEGPEFHPGDRPVQDGSTRAVLDVTAISNGRDWHAASGLVLLSITGDRRDLACGSPIFAAGSLGSIPGPMNPGEADRRDRARAEGIRLRMSVGDSFSVWPDPEGKTRREKHWIGRAREASYRLLVSKLDADVSALAAALLLGRREAVDPDVNDAFARTGTTHLLAISGLHLQALAGLLFLIFRLFGIARKRAFIGVLLATVGYALLVGLTPSVVRSAAMTVLVCMAGLCDRCSEPANALGFAAIGTMALNPSYLFDAGCQLSFLCVMGLFWAVPPLLPEPRGDPDDEPTPMSRLDALERRLEPRWKRRRRRVVRWFLKGILASLVAWLITVPLVALRFHVIAPVGVLLNIPLIPITSFALFFAGLTLMASLVWAPLGSPSAWACGVLLRWTNEIVAWGSARPMGHVFTAGPSPGWTLSFYALLALAGWSSFRLWKGRRLLWATLALEAVLAIVVVLCPAPPETLEADVLAVDHGLAVVIQGEDGRTIVYDCGKMRDPRVGRRVIAPALWSRGVRRIDSIVLSHADSDHFNGLPDLLDRFTVGEVLVPPGFGGGKNPEATSLLKTVRARGVPVRQIVAGDQLDLAGGQSRVLHPPRNWLPGAADNARSVVVAVSGRGGGPGLLLTGDLDGVGLAELASHPRPAMLAMLSPHHGGRTANPDWFYRWAEPKRVIVSQKRPSHAARDPVAILPDRGIIVDRTWNSGALSLRFGKASLDVHAFLTPEPPVVAASQVPLGMRATVTILGVALGLGVVVAMAIVEWGAWTLVMPGRRLAGSVPEPPPWVPIEVRAKDGVRLHGARLGIDPSAAGTAILLHGFGEDRGAMLGRAESLARRGWNVAVLDTRGRGRSEGDRTAFGGREAEDLHAWLDVFSPDGTPVVAWGRSMGAAIAARAAVEDSRIAAVILEAPYADLRDAVASWIGRMHLPAFFAVPILLRARQLAGVSLHEPRPIEVAPAVTVPVMILHGTEDPVVPVADARRLANAFGGAVEVLEIVGAKHGDVFERGGEELAIRIDMWMRGGIRAPYL
ncbi:MAG: internalization-related competence protein ComEC/Rec2 [Planctomycetota bacterium]|nr:internalization-related competence protein ComEC/Rec2 [Planctomycetota bacterium]